MPIPLTSVLTAEIAVNGLVAAGGSNTRKAQSIWHYRRVATSVAPSKSALYAQFATDIIPLLRACISSRYTGVNVGIRWVDDALDSYTFFTNTGAGLVTGDSMPTTESAFLLFGTGLRGKSYRGSKHIFPLAESATTTGSDDILNAGALTYFGALAAAALLPLTDASPNTWNPCVLSRKLSQLRTNPTTVTRNDVVSVSVNKRIGTMRHRKVASVY